MAETKAAFRRRVGRMLRILVTATATSGGGSSFVAASLLDHFPTDDDMVDAAIYSATQSTWRRCSAWVASTFTGTVNRTFPIAIGTDALEVYNTFNPDELDAALQDALTEAYPYLATQVVNTSLIGVVSQYEYTIPSTITDLNRMLGGKVEAEVDTAVSTYPYQEVRGWTTRDTRMGNASGAHTLIIPPAEMPGVGNTIRLTGLGVLPYPSTDATSIPLSEEALRLLAYKVCEVIWRDYAPQATGRDRDYASSQAQKYAAQYDRYKDMFGIWLEPTAMQNMNLTSGLDLALARFAEPA